MTKQGLRSTPRYGVVLDVLIALFCAALLLSLLDVRLVFLNTHVAGGDMVSHPWLAHSFLESLKNGRLYHWNHGWFGGFPFLYYYFYPIYMLTSALVLIGIPEAIAFKVMVLIVILSVPLATYVGARQFLSRGSSFFVTLLSLALFLDESHSSWGGNFKSVMAGQVSHQLGLSCFILLFGFLVSGQVQSRRMIATFALALMSHVYSALYATVLGIIALMDRILEKTRRQIHAPMVLAGLLAAGLTCFWWLPFLSYRAFTATPLNNVEVSLTEALRVLRLSDPFFRVFYVLTGIFLLPAIRDARTRRLTLFIGVVAAGSVVLLPYLKNSPFLHIRLIPQFVFLCLFVIMLGLKAFEKSGKTNLFQIGVACLGLIIFTGRLVPAQAPMWPSFLNFSVKETQTWWSWNMSGLERKADFEDARLVFEKLNDLPKSDGRVVAEYSNYNRMGSARVFETLPYFTDRPVMEGLTIESSNANAFYFYSMFFIQKKTWWPGFPVTVPGQNMQKGLDFFSLYHVKYFIASSDDVRGEFRRMGLPEIYSNSTFSIFEVNADSHLVSRLEGPLPVLKTPRPLYTSVLGLPGSMEHFVILENAKEANGQLDRISLPAPQTLVGLESEWSNDGQTLRVPRTGASTGNPVRLLFKVPYFPNWRASSGEGVKLVTPNLMVVETQVESLELAFKIGWPEKIGLGISFFSLILFVFWRKIRKSMEMNSVPRSSS